MEEKIAVLVSNFVVSEERAKELVLKHPSLEAFEIAQEEGLEDQEWMDEEDVARENCE